MAWRGSDTSVEERGLPRALRAVAWLRRHRELVVVLAVAGIVVSFVLDLLIPGYAIAGFYLFPLLLVTFALSERRAVGILSAVCLGLTIYVLVLQDRANAQNILLVAFGVVAGAGLIELGSLYNRYDRLYEKERATTVRLHSLTTSSSGCRRCRCSTPSGRPRSCCSTSSPRPASSSPATGACSSASITATTRSA